MKAIRSVFLAAILVASGGLLACSDDDVDEPEANSSPGASQVQASPVAATNGTPGSLNAVTAFSEQLQALAGQVQSSVVAVIVENGEGSGVIWDDQGHIVTNQHVVADAQNVSIALASGERLDAEVIATDPLTDLAVLRVQREGLPSAEFDEELPQAGALVLAVGNPLGFESSVSAGIVSGLHRAIPSGGATPALVDLLQTDAAISPGNSGGALVGADGRVVGINVAYLPPSQSGAVSIGFAIPAVTVKDVVEQLLESGVVQHAFLGIQPRPLTPAIAQQLDLNVSNGVLVFGVSSGGAADNAGLQPGDVIVSFGETEIESVEDLFAALREHAPGEEVDVVLVREGDEQTLSVTLDERPPGS